MTTLQSMLTDPKTADRLHRTAGKALKKCRPKARELAHQQIAEALSRLLDIDLTELVLDAWAGADELMEAAEQTRRDPELRTVVDLADQHFSGHRDATLDVVVDDLTVADLPVRLQLELGVRALVAAVQHGCLVAISSGRATIVATLLIDGVALPSYTLTLDLTVTLTPSPPIPLGRRPAEVRLPDVAQPPPRPVRS